MKEQILEILPDRALSLSEFVDLCYYEISAHLSDDDTLSFIESYNNFLKQPLELWMLVVDEDAIKDVCNGLDAREQGDAYNQMIKDDMGKILFGNGEGDVSVYKELIEQGYTIGDFINNKVTPQYWVKALGL